MRFTGEVWYWRGPAPYHFVTVPDELSRDIAEVANEVTYGWGMIPVRVKVGGSTWPTSLWPKDGGYVVPLKTAVRRKEDIEVGRSITLELEIVAATR